MEKLLIFLVFIAFSKGDLLDDNPYRHFEVLDPKYHLEWTADWDTKRVTFNVKVQTSGWVGFGLSRKGNMTGADIIMGGVTSDGTPYFSDKHGVGKEAPVPDQSQDWTLHSAWERNGETFLSFSRAFDTCDVEHDLPISNDVTALIWAYSEVDTESQYHFGTRGVFYTHLLDPDLTPRNFQEIREGRAPLPKDMNIFNITRNVPTISGQDTLYWCSFHSVPPINKKHQIVGWNTAFPTDEDRRNVHHLMLARCRAPPGVDPDEFFGPATRSDGVECYIQSQEFPLPVSYCRETIHSWAVAGKPVWFPDHVGLPMHPGEYFMLQVHYDTPLNISVTPTVSLEMFYTNKLREYDAGMIMLGDLTPGAPTVIVPPGEPNHILYGHCSPGCTERMFPDGMTLFASFLHTHTIGTGVRSLHFRNNKELPFILNDDNYNFNYQQMRLLRKERRVLPGDQLTMRCTYDSTPRNGAAVYGGFSTREEMCTAFMYYYSRSPGFSLCRSEIRDRRYWDFLGIRNVTWDQSIRQVVITSPPELSGLTMSDFVNHEITWDLRTRKTLQNLQVSLPKVTVCSRFFYDNPKEQLQIQLQPGGIYQRTGRLPGSDGRAFDSVDEDNEHTSVRLGDMIRYRKPPQCSRRGFLPQNSNEL